MESPGKNELCKHATLKTMTRYFVKFEQCICPKSNHFKDNLDTNTIDHISELELYIILSTLEKFKSWNWTVLI